MAHFTMPPSVWEQYVKYRPQYPDTLFTSWLAYHTGALESIHDIGTGCGIGASKLIAAAKTKSQQIRHAYLSDPGESNITATKACMQQAQYPDMALTFMQKKAEDAILPEQVDLVISCECLHWTDIDVAMDRIAQSVRHGGTFATVFYHIIGIPQDNPRAADALGRVTNARYAALAREPKYKNNPQFCRGQLNVSTGLDYLPLDTEKWEDVRRIYVNCDRFGNKWIWPEATKDLGEPPKSRVSSNEKMELVEDEGWNMTNCTVEWVKGCLTSDGMEFEESGAFESEDWKEFVAAVEDNGGTFHNVIPAAIVLARRK